MFDFDVHVTWWKWKLVVCYMTWQVSLWALYSTGIAMHAGITSDPHVSGYFWTRNFFFPDSKISPSTRSVFKSNSPVHKHLHWSTQGSSAIKCVQCMHHSARDSGSKYVLLFLMCRCWRHNKIAIFQERKTGLFPACWILIGRSISGGLQTLYVVLHEVLIVCNLSSMVFYARVLCWSPWLFTFFLHYFP